MEMVLHLPCTCSEVFHGNLESKDAPPVGGNNRPERGMPGGPKAASLCLNIASTLTQ